jgi:ABC-2 type transport system permease protein
MKSAPQASGRNGLLWLFTHELRLLWRGSILVRTQRHVLAPVIGVGVVFQAVALAIAWAAGRQAFSLPVLILIANLNIIFLFFLMLSRAMTSAIDVLYSRGDVDFLLASPIPPHRVLAVRMIGVAASVSAPWVLLGGVMANGLAVFGHWHALAAYPVIAGIAVLATALAFSLVVVLVAKAGARRARGLAHLLALVIGVAIFALGQAPRYVPARDMLRLWHGLMPGAENTGSPLWWPGRAMLGQPLPLTAFAAAALAAFCAVLALLRKSFASGAISAAAHAHGGTARQRKGDFRAAPFGAAVAKDLRLLLRFPGLLTQTVYRSLTLVPVAMILTGRVAIGSGPGVVVPLVVFLSGQLSLFFVSVIIGSEQSPDLLRSAPVKAALGARAAQLAAVYGTLAVMALPIIGVMLRNAAELPVLLVFMAGAAACNLALGEKLPIPLLRPEFGKARTGTILGLILGVFVSTVWSFAAWLLVTPHPFAFLKIS